MTLEKGIEMYNKEYSKQWYQKNKERILQQEKERKEANPELYKQKAKKYYQTDSAKEKAKEYRKKNKDKRNEQQKEFYQRNKQKCLQQKREHYAEHKEEEKARHERWRESKKEQKRKPYYELAKKYEHKPIPGFEGKYEAFENGKIWIVRSNKFWGKKNDYQGYEPIALTKNGDQTYTKIHRIIALTFDDRTEEELQDLVCHHLDISAGNSRLENLVFLNNQLHEAMHKLLSKEVIKSIGSKVKDLRGSQKTNQFEKLIKDELKKVLDIL